MRDILVTGAAGFIGFHVVRQLLARGERVVGVDNLNDYYPPELKRDRLRCLADAPDFQFEVADVADLRAMERLFARHFHAVVHLAAQAGVRYSLNHPYPYIQSNLVGFAHILEGCRQTGVAHLVYASSSSVYGLNTTVPFAVTQCVDHPISLYAATKKANEVMAHAYSHLYQLPTTGLRFFTVYGPWGRPDMALYSFTKAILAGQPIQLFNHGHVRRDFTYIDDIVQGIVRVIDRVAEGDPQWSPVAPTPGASSAPYRVYNIGNHQPVEVGKIVDLLEANLGRRAIRVLAPMQPGDVLETYADVDDLSHDVGFRPATPIEEGIRRFVEWYRSYHSS